MDSEGSANPLRALLHSHQSPALAVGGHVGIETAPVVSNLQTHCVWLVSKLDLNGAGIPVPYRIADSFLRNPQKLNLRLRGKTASG